MRGKEDEEIEAKIKAKAAQEEQKLID